MHSPESRTAAAIDIDSAVVESAKPGVIPVVGDCTDLTRFTDGSFAQYLRSPIKPMTGQMLVVAA